MSSISNITELWAYFTQHKEITPTDFYLNAHKPIKIYVKSMGKPPDTPISVLFEDVDDLLKFLKDNGYASYTIRNYLHYLWTALHLDIVKNTFQDINTWQHVASKISSIMKKAQSVANKETKKNKTTKTVCNDDDTPLDINTIELEQQPSENGSDSHENEQVHTLEEQLNTLQQRVAELSQENDTLHTTKITLESQVTLLTIEKTRLAAINQCLESEKDKLWHMFELIHKHT